MKEVIGYIQNLSEFKLEKFILGEEEKLMILPIEKGFDEFIGKTRSFFIELADELKKESFK